MMAESDNGRRSCRCCGESYDYPGVRSLATRTYCEHCVEIAPEARRAVERMRRRIDRLTKEVEKLKGSD